MFIPLLYDWSMIDEICETNLGTGGGCEVQLLHLYDVDNIDLTDITTNNTTYETNEEFHDLINTNRIAHVNE